MNPFLPLRPLTSNIHKPEVDLSEVKESFLNARGGSPHPDDVLTEGDEGLGQYSLEMTEEVKGGVWQLEESEATQAVSELVVTPDFPQQIRPRLLLIIYLSSVITRTCSSNCCQ